MEIIKNVERVTAGLLSSEPMSTHGISFVYKNAKGEYRLIENGAQLSRLELRGSRYTIRCSVVRGAFTYRHLSEYPSMNPGKTFRITIQFSVAVTDPIKVVEFDVQNINKYLDDNMPYWLAGIFENYAIEDFREVQQLIKNLDQNIGMQKDLEARGFSISQFQATVGLSESDWSHFEKIEEMKKHQDIEKRKIEEQQELQKMKIEKDKELTRMQAEIEEIRKQKELLLEEIETRSKLETERLIFEEKLKTNELLLEKMKKEGDLGRTVLTSDSVSQINQTILKDIEDKKELQRQLINKLIESGDFSDPEYVLKMMGAITEIGSSSAPKQIGGDIPQQKKLSWGGRKDEKESTVSSNGEWTS